MQSRKQLYRIMFLCAILFLLNGENIIYAQKTRSISFIKSSLKTKIQKAEDGNEYQKLVIADLESTKFPGKPNLPVKKIRLIIPADQEVSDIVVNIQNTEEIKLKNKIYPVQPDVPTSQYPHKIKFVKPDSVIYSSELPWPGKPVRIINDGYFDGTNHIVNIEVCPFRYYPKLDKVEFISDLSFTLQMKHSSKKIISSGNKSEANQEIYDRALKLMVDNPEDISFSKSVTLSKTASVNTIGPLPAYEYVIITSNALSSSFYKLINWKKRKGINIGIVTVEQINANYSGDLVSGINDNAGKIRQYLKDSYENPTSPTMWALLGGDFSVVPIRYGCGYRNYWSSLATNDYEIPADLYFADFNTDWDVDSDEFTGEYLDDGPNDYYPEIFVGRLLCKNSQEISRWIDKVILYEQNPGKGSTGYLTRSLMFQSDQMQDGQQAQGVRNILTSFTHTIREEQPSYNSANPTYPTGADIISDMNSSSRYGLWSWLGHGSPLSCIACSDSINTRPWSLVSSQNTGEGYSNGYIENLTNTDYPAIVYSISCDNTPLDDYDPHNWGWGSGYNLGEAFTILNSAGGPAFLGNTRYGFVYDSHLLYRQFATLINGGTTNLGVAELSSKATYGDHYLAYAHNLIGCPETKIWTATPSQYSSVSVSDNGSSLTVNCGVSGSKICVCSTDNGATYYSVVTGSSATFNTSVRPLHITITKMNYLPYMALTGGTLSGSFTIAGNLRILGNITIPSGMTLTAGSGSSFQFDNGTSLTVNGTLNAEGTSSNRITFTRSGSSGTWSGIRFNSGSSGTVKYCNISYVSNTAGIYCNNSYPTIEDNVLDNMSDIGIYLYNASPTVVGNSIQGNSSSYGSVGIKCDESSSPQIGRNTIRYFTKGVGSYRYSSPYFWDGSGTGRNKVVRTSTAVYGYYYSNPYFGQSNYPWGTNHVDSASTYFVNAETNTNIMAENNWWGTASPSSSKFYAVSSSSIDYTPYLTSAPTLSIRNDGNDRQTTPAIAYKVVGGDVSGVTQGSSSLLDDEDLKSALKYEFDKDYESASKIYEKVFKKEPNTDKGKYALVKLGSCYKKNGKSGIANYLSSISDSYKNQKKDDVTVIAYDLINHELLATKEYDKIAANLLRIKNELSPNSETERSTLYGLVSLYVNCLNDTKTATGYYEEFRQKYPNDALLTDCKILLGYSYDGTQEAKNASKDSPAIISKQEEVKIDNYPNPFNPSTTISFTLPQKSNVKLVVYDVLGKEVATLANSNYEAGKYSFTFNGSSLASGMYFYTLTTSQGMITKKMMLVK